ncbi:family 90 glycosyltransferase [Melampsora larici-populina 98AG31]|uniref:Family 90 glycosyltransferase n=1 Tax=Melampsora larici-populina (strain 98AG31 / pathotype 3-4-7) TaxID=747676 RepID=F4R939_MELLP|nr:family 90 glycosyltransferase [Melampsora larici-populina 98AG31]EGG11221.1 family 90 glycosyltransferase [Melampsora larici-populina 98AG31]
MISPIRFKSILYLIFVFILFSIFYTIIILDSSNRSSLTNYLSNHSNSIKSSIIPNRFKWSTWNSNDFNQLEDHLLINQTNSNSNSTSTTATTTTNTNTSSSIINPTYHQNGYYLLPNQSKFKSHPILSLIERSQKEWNEKLQRNSKSLAECITEYKRRYKRSPPYGFEKWWEYVIKSNVILKDEYDQIEKDLKPFLAIEPNDLNHRSWVMSNERPETFTLSIPIKSNQNVTISGPEAHLVRATDLANLINLFVDLLPLDEHQSVYNLTFTKHDQPAVQMTYSRKQKMLDLADAGEYLSPSDYIKPNDPKLSNWANACSTSSSLYHNETHQITSEEEDLLKLQKSFIFDHPAAMDLCQHPESKSLHGFTSAPGTDNIELVPLFTFAKTTTQNDVLVTPLEQFSDTYIGDDPSWNSKKLNKLLWRGSTTGAEFMKGIDWKSSQRSRLHFISHENKITNQPDRLKVLVEDSKTKEVNVLDRELKRLNDRFMDTSFSGGPVQCDPETCDYMRSHIQFAHTMGLDESYQYKYLIDLDGNGWSGRFHRLMSTKSLVLKSTIFPEWYADRVQPWVHYVPIKVDYSDLYDVMVFFLGDENQDPNLKEIKKGHDDLAEKIATDGKRWAAEHWRREDMAAYMFRLVLEWRRIMLRGQAGVKLDYGE